MISTRQIFCLALQLFRIFSEKIIAYLYSLVFLLRNLQQRPNGIDILELPNQTLLVPIATCCYCLVVNVLQKDNIWLYRLTTEITAIICISLHGKGKAGKLIATLVNVHTVKVVLQDKSRNLLGAIPLFFIHLAEQIESINQDVTTSHTWVDEADVFYALNILRNWVGLVVGRLYIIRHFCF